MTDALEMKAISGRRSGGGCRPCDRRRRRCALCLGHDLFDGAVASVRCAGRGGQIGRPSRGASGRGGLEGRRQLPPGRRSRRAASSTATLVGARHASRSGARAGAARAATNRRRAEPEPGMAAGRLSQTPGEWFAASVPGCRGSRSTSTRGDRGSARREAARGHRARCASLSAARGRRAPDCRCA